MISDLYRSQNAPAAWWTDYEGYSFISGTKRKGNFLGIKLEK